MSTDAITVLKQDHKDVKALFRKFEQDPGDDVKGRLVTQMIELLTVHTYIENECIFPELRKLLPDLEDDILESYEEHHVADMLLFELHALTPDDVRFDAKTTV